MSLILSGAESFRMHISVDSSKIPTSCVQTKSSSGIIIAKLGQNQLNQTYARSSSPQLQKKKTSPIEPYPLAHFT